MSADAVLSTECPRCGGIMEDGSTTFTAEMGFGVVVVRHVPARVCRQCGEEWVANDAAHRLSDLVEDARKRHEEVSVRTFA